MLYIYSMESFAKQHYPPLEVAETNGLMATSQASLKWVYSLQIKYIVKFYVSSVVLETACRMYYRGNSLRSNKQGNLNTKWCLTWTWLDSGFGKDMETRRISWKIIKLFGGLLYIEDKVE